MLKSYETINYSLRPAKCIQRKMMAEVFRRLSEFAAIESYRYIGFGSPYFSDFLLFHKSLGIKHMISIEHDSENEARFNFNRPYKCIKIEWGESNDVLPTLPWNIKTLLWLDYDGKLTGSVLEDVAYFCASAIPGSVIVVTVNAEPEKLDPYLLDRSKGYGDQILEFRMAKLIEDLGEEKIPLDISGKDLAEWNKARVYHRIITSEIRQTLQVVNGGRAAGNEILYKQLFNFHYADGAKMLTLGGVLYERGQSHIVAKCAFEELPFVRTADEPYSIETPLLTYRELRYLDTKLPSETPAKLEAEIPIPEEDLQRYEKIYRYFPMFAETEI